MNHFNHQNVQLAYEAVYNQDLCESMEDLGLIDGYDYLDEGYKKLPIDRMMMQIGRKAMRSGLKLGNIGYTHFRDEAAMGNKSMKQINKMARVASRHSLIKGKGRVRSEGQAELNRRRGQNEEVELYDIILEYLIQEGYADTLGSAEIILENMSDEWIEDILLENKGYGDDSKFKGDTDASDFIPGKTVPKPKSYGRLSRFAPSPLSGERSRTASNVRRTVGESPNQPRAVQIATERKARRVIPSRFDNN